MNTKTSRNLMSISLVPSLPLRVWPNLQSHNLLQNTKNTQTKAKPQKPSINTLIKKPFHIKTNVNHKIPNTKPKSKTENLNSLSFDQPKQIQTDVNNNMSTLESANAFKSPNCTQMYSMFSNLTNSPLMKNKKLITTLMNTKFLFNQKKKKKVFTRSTFIIQGAGMTMWYKKHERNKHLYINSPTKESFDRNGSEDSKNGESWNMQLNKKQNKMPGKNSQWLTYKRMSNDILRTSGNSTINNNNNSTKNRNPKDAKPRKVHLSDQILTEHLREKHDEGSSPQNKRRYVKSITLKGNPGMLFNKRNRIKWPTHLLAEDEPPRNLDQYFNNIIQSERGTYLPTINSNVRKPFKARANIKHKTKHEILDEYFLNNLYKINQDRKKENRPENIIQIKDFFCRNQWINLKDIIKHNTISMPSTQRKSPEISFTPFNAHCNSSNFYQRHIFGIKSFSIFGLCEGSGPHSYWWASLVKESFAAALFTGITYNIFSNTSEDKIFDAITANSFFLIKNVFASANTNWINSNYDTEKNGVTVGWVILIKDMIITANWGDILTIGWIKEDSSEKESLVTRELGARHWGEQDKISGCLGMNEVPEVTHEPIIKMIQYSKDWRNIVIGTNSLFEEGGWRNIFKVVTDKRNLNVTWEEQTRKITEYIIQVNLGKIEEYERWKELEENKLNESMPNMNTKGGVGGGCWYNKCKSQWNQSVYIPKRQINWEEMYVKSYSVVIIEFM